MKISKLLFALPALFLLSFPSLLPAQKKQTADFSRLVVVGDSLSAGFENFSLLNSQQIHGYASVFAEQAGTSLVLPLVPYPGAPNALALTSAGPPPVIEPIAGQLPSIPRENPFQQPTNLAVPGVTIAQILNQRPNPTATSPVAQLANIVLGFPTPFVVPGLARTQIEQAVALQPTAVIAWVGNNDALLPAITGNLPALTSTASFRNSYKTILDALGNTNATLITANIPDVTKVGYFEPVAQFAVESGLPLSTVTSTLGIAADDYLRLPALVQAQKILTGQVSGPLNLCDSPTPGLGVGQVPCVLTASDAQLIQTMISSYNSAIAAEAAAHGAVLVDIYTLVNKLYAKGAKIAGQQLTTDFLGGLFSLDGFHPTNTGYALIANEFIQTVNKELKTKIPQVSVDAVEANDPLAHFQSDNGEKKK